MKVRCPQCGKKVPVQTGYQKEWVQIDGRWVCPDHKSKEPEPKQLDMLDFLEDD